jgi:hypothetical protein
MNDMHSRAGLLRRAWQRVLDGDRLWGSIDIRADRFGVTRYRLVVYPPGVNDAERRRVRVARGSPMWGGAAWVLSEIVTTQFTGPWTALAISTAAVLAAAYIAVSMAGETRRRVHTMCAAVMVGLPDPAAIATAGKLKALAGCLIEADSALRDGRLSPAEHEVIWWRVYDEIGRVTPTVHRPEGVA